MTLRPGTYRSACGCLLHRRDGASGSRWEAQEDDGHWRDVELASTARPVLLSDDPDWPGPERVREAVLYPD